MVKGENVIYLYIVLAFFVFIFLKSFIRVFRSSRFIGKFKGKEFEVPKDKKLTLIIPVYKEVNNIEKSILYFKDLADKCNVYYVTTSKEEDGATYKEVEAQMTKHNTTNIYLMNCPNTEGNMATQITYMAKNLEPDDIIGLYNIDSFPELKTFDFILANIEKGMCYQQLSYFEDDLDGAMASAQDWQNRWSIVYEMGKLARESNFLNFKYTIGHGLFIYQEDLARLGFWDDTIINEDNELGYRMLCNDFKIKAIPYLEKAEFAHSKSIYVKQQSTWFNGPLYAFDYYKREKKKGKKASLLYAMLNFKAAVSWLLLPWFFYTHIIISAFFSWWIFAAYILLMISYLSGINFMSRQVLYKYGYIRKRFSRRNILSDIFFFTMHTLGPMITLKKLITGKNTIKNKYKTEK